VLRARAAAVVAPLALLAGCVRSLRSEPAAGGPADTGVPLAFALDGAGPGVEWRWGDGTAGSRGPRASHAFARAGHYEVQALVDGRAVAVTGVDVRPRPVLRAVPELAQGALYCPAPGAQLDAVADLLDGMLGPGNAAELIGRTGALHLALQSAGAGEGAVDPDEGFAFFTLPGVSGVLGAVGVTDPEAALSTLGQSLEEQGAGLSQSAEGYVRVQWPGRPDAAAFADRGYLYVALPERGAPAQVEEQLRRAVNAVSADGGRGAERWPLIAESRGAVPEGPCAVAVPGRAGAMPRGFYGTLRLEGRELLVDGVFRADQPLWRAPASAPALLGTAPEGPVIALSVSAPAEAVAALLLGPRGTPERARSAEALKEEGWDVEGVVDGVGDDAAVLGYFDAPAFLANLIRGNREPEPRGALWADARLRRMEPALRAVREALEAKGVEYVQRPGSEVLRFRAMEQPAEVTVGPERLQLRAGAVAPWRRQTALREALAARAGSGSFGPGHVSLLVDLGRLEDELRAPAPVPGVAEGRVEDVQRFATRFIDQLTGVRELAVDLAPDPLGARLHARVTVGKE
jgi:PKD domain-containing protein